MKIFENSKEWAIEVFEMIIQGYVNEWIEKYAITNWLSTIFLAGAPGAGKTEFLETVLDTENFIVIDIDKYRQYFKWYNGRNADLYQDSCSRVATRIFDYCIKNNLKLIFDGTLTSEIWLKNIKKALEKERKMGIVLIYQDPVISYSYTIARQERNERKVDIDTFLRIYYSSIHYVFEVVEKYTEIQFVIGSKNKKREWKQFFYRKKDKFDKHFHVEYNEKALRDKLCQLNGNTLYNIKCKLWLIKN